MANDNGATEVAQTSGKEQDVNGQAEPAQDEDASGQQPDSMCNWILLQN